MRRSTISGAVTTYDYDPAGNRTKLIDSANATTTYEYDFLNRETTVTDPMQKVTVTGYDAVGNKILEIDAESQTTTIEYDLLDRQTKTTDPEGNWTESVYDDAGNKTSESKSDGTSVEYGFDLANRMRVTTDALERPTFYDPDEVGNQTTVTPFQGAATVNVYDDNNRLVSSANGTQTTSYTYYKTGERKTETKPGDKTTTYNINDLGQTTSTVDPDIKTTSFAYDIQGNKISQVETSLTIWYTYDELGSQIKLVDSNGRIKGQRKDAKGRTIGSTDINGSVDFGYDVNDRVESLKVSGEASTTFGYNGNGSRTAYRQANSVNTGFWYDDAGKLSAIETSTSGGTKLLDLSYQYVDESNIGTETIGGQNQAFGYDDADQLKSWTSTASVETTYTYDDAGNRTKAGDTTFGYATSTNQLISMASGSATYTYSYDPSGNLNTVTDGIDTTTYTFNGDNRLMSISSSSTSATFTYDAEGKRTSKTVNGTTTYFVYDDIQLIAEKDGSGTITARYFYDDSGQLVSMKKGGNNYYFHLNHRGDVIKVTDGAEAVVASYSYDPWGNILSSTETVTDLQPFRYASYYFDSDLGVYYLINRYYDPVIGRFSSKDPAGDPEDVSDNPAENNSYAYGSNNPVMNTDPDGLWALRTMYRGLSGGDINWAQRALIELGYAIPAGATSYFGNQTYEAAKAFQRAFVDMAGVSLVVDGIIGPKTGDRLIYQIDTKNGKPTAQPRSDFYGSVQTQQKPRSPAPDQRQVSFQDYFSQLGHKFPFPDHVEVGWANSPNNKFYYNKSQFKYNGVHYFVGKIPYRYYSGFDVDNPHLHDFRAQVLRAAIASGGWKTDMMLDMLGVVVIMVPSAPASIEVMGDAFAQAKDHFFQARAWEQNRRHYYKRFLHIHD